MNKWRYVITKRHGMCLLHVIGALPCSNSRLDRVYFITLRQARQLVNRYNNAWIKTDDVFSLCKS